MFDAKAFSDAIVDSCKAFVSRSLEPIIARLDAIEAKATTQVSVSSALIDRDGQLVLTMSDGSTKALGLVVGKDGEAGQNGSDGKDGFSLDAFDVQLAEDGRTLEFAFEDEHRKAAAAITLPVLIYQGVYSEGKAYAPGDTATFGGSLWHCKAATEQKPGTGDDWQLAVKKGRDAK